MVIKVYISGISGNKEVKKRQQRVLLILDSKNVKYEVIDIAEPGAEEIKDFVQINSTASGATISDPNPRHPLPPQIFNEDVYCGDYDMFDMANEIDEMEKFLKLEVGDVAGNTPTEEITLKNGEIPSEQKISDESKENEINENETEKNEAEKNESEKTESEKNETEKKETEKNETKDNENEVPEVQQEKTEDVDSEEKLETNDNKVSKETGDQEESATSDDKIENGKDEIINKEPSPDKADD